MLFAGLCRYFYFMNFLNKLLSDYPLIKNKYFITGVCFLVWIIFFDKYSLINQYEERNTLFGLRKEKHYYQEEIKNTRNELNELITDNKTLEKFAREKYLMKKENEDIWLVIPDTAGTANSED